MPSKQEKETTIVDSTPTKPAATTEKVEKTVDTAEKKVVKSRKKAKKSVPYAKVFVKATYNNTLITITDPKGNVIAWASSGNCGFKGTKKSTPYAAQVATEKAMTNAEGFGISEVDVYINGVGPGRDQSVRGIITKGNINILSITDTTPIPHGGCRRKKPRRV